jgi:ribosomal protein S18 acetylase RimI-like enzyme
MKEKLPGPILFVGKLSIRPYAEDDIPAILEVYRQNEDFLSLGPVPTASLQMVRDDIAHSHQTNGFFCVVSHKESGIIGVLDYTPPLADPTIAVLSLLMIAASYRRMGYGKLIMEAFEKFLVNNYQTKVIEAGVMVNNPLAIRFWQRMGFSISPTPEPMPDKTTVFRMSKNTA